MNRNILFKLLGYIVVLASLFFVVDKSGDLLKNTSIIDDVGGYVPVIAVLSLFYAIIGFLLSYAWYCIVSMLANEVDLREMHYVYGYTQIAKYLPGNVFHIAGRYALLSRLGISHGSIIKASISEVAGLMGGVLLSVLVLYSFTYKYFDKILFDGALLAAMAMASLVVLVYLFVRRNRIGDGVSDNVFIALSFRTISVYLAFFLLGGLLLFFMAFSVDSQLGVPNFFIIVALYPISWLLGYVVPGAPSGIGVREASLVFLLEPLVGSESGVLIAVLFRLVTLFGDVLFFVLSITLFSTKLRQEKS